MNPLDVFNRVHRIPAGAISATEQGVLLALLSTVDSTNGYSGWATQGQLAAWAKVTDRSVRNALTSLTAKGLVVESETGGRAHTFAVVVSEIDRLSRDPGTTFHMELRSTRKHVPEPRKHVPVTPEPRSYTAPHYDTSAPHEESHEQDPIAERDRPTLQPTGGDRPTDRAEADAPCRMDPASQGVPDGGLFDLGAPVPDPRPAARGVRRKRQPAGETDGADGVAALWADLDAIRRKNVTGAGASLLTAGRRGHLAARMSEHGADTLRAMVEWLTGCRCGTCHACRWSQPKGYTSADTYLRPDNCAKYVEAARERGAMAFTTAPGEDWAEADACRLLAARCIESGADIDPPDRRVWLLTRRTLRIIGGRAVWRGKTSTPAWAEAWRAEWPNSIADLNTRRESL